MFFDIICSAFDIGILYIYLKKILGTKKETIPNCLYFASFIIVETILFCFTMFVNITNPQIHIILTSIISFVTTFLLTLFHDGLIRHKLFVGISFQVFAGLSESIVFLAASFLPKELSQNFASDDIYGAIISKFVLFILLNITILIWNRNSQKSNYSIQYTMLVLIMPTLSMLLLMLIPKKTNLSIIQTVLSFIGISGILLTNLTNYLLLENILKMNEILNEKETLNTQIIYQTNKYQQISTAYRNTRRLVHDIKKHLFYIQTCTERKNYDNIIPYIKDVVHDIEQTHLSTNTGNLVIDAFVSNHMYIAHNENINFNTDIQSISGSLPISDYDFSIILGNLLDNSLNACRKISCSFPRQISVTLFTTELEFVIHISNTTFKEDKCLNTEYEQLYHGYGQKNIAKIVQKYSGVYTNYTENNWYHSIISIPLVLPPK